jgi:hypothetical protein
MSLIVLDVARTTTKTTSATSGNETDLGTSGGVAANGRRVTNVLMVTTTMGVIHGLKCERKRKEHTFIATPRTVGQELRLDLNFQ